MTSETLIILQDSYSYVRSTAPAVAYDSKQYYQQPTATAAVAAAQPQPSVADTYYQTGTLKYFSTPLLPNALICNHFDCLLSLLLRNFVPTWSSVSPHPHLGDGLTSPSLDLQEISFCFPFHCHQVFAKTGLFDCLGFLFVIVLFIFSFI